jgi:hypothetical protein
MSNNPFIDNSAPAYQRYPDISQNGPQSSGYGAPSWQQQPEQGYPQQQQQYGQGYGGVFQPQQTGYGGGMQQQPMATEMPSSGFRPSSLFGQQLSAQLGTPGGAQPSPYGGLYGGGGMGYQPTGYMGQQNQQQGQWGQPQQADWKAIAQFDPYANLGSLNAQTGSGAGLFGGSASSSAIQSTLSSYGSMSYQGGGGAGAPSGELHPREVVHRYKRELEGWDPVAWKQLTNSFNVLKSAWDARGRAVQDRVRGLGNMPSYDYGASQENQRLSGVSAAVQPLKGVR